VESRRRADNTNRGRHQAVTLIIDMSQSDAATFRRSTTLHKKKLAEAMAAVKTVEQSDAMLRNQQGHLVVLEKQLDDARARLASAVPGGLVPLELDNPRRLALCTGLHILVARIRRWIDQGIELTGGESKGARAEIKHIEALLSRLDDETALELGYADEKPVRVAPEGIADIRQTVLAEQARSEQRVVKENERRPTA
jgi:hypothetical protein